MCRLPGSHPDQEGPVSPLLMKQRKPAQNDLRGAIASIVPLKLAIGEKHANAICRRSLGDGVLDDRGNSTGQILAEKQKAGFWRDPERTKVDGEAGGQREQAPGWQCEADRNESHREKSRKLLGPASAPFSDERREATDSQKDRQAPIALLRTQSRNQEEPRHQRAEHATDRVECLKHAGRSGRKRCERTRLGEQNGIDETKRQGGNAEQGQGQRKAEKLGRCEASEALAPVRQKRGGSRPQRRRRRQSTGSHEETEGAARPTAPARQPSA